MDFIETEMITSLATIALVILCIAVFIAYGAGMLFYGIVAVTFAVGLVNAWLVARDQSLGMRKQKTRAAPRQRRRSPGRRRKK